MRIAVWRYSLSLQTELDSVVGGGRLTRAAIDALRTFGEPVVVCKAGSKTEKWLATEGIEYQPKLKDISSFDAAVVLTGPSNLMFGTGVLDTYERLASLPRGASAVYAQWDQALPMMMRPELSKGFAQRSTLGWKDIKHLRWSVLAQVPETALRATKSKPTAYHLPFLYRRCLFELAECDGKPMQVCRDPIQAVGYFGSDRAGRLKELQRWFGWPGAPPLHVYGKWSFKAKDQFAGAPSVVFHDPVPEGLVRAMLNRYAMTFYMADPCYVKADFVAQRFFENAMAGVPTLYSDKLQPSVFNSGIAPLVMADPMMLRAAFDSVCAHTYAERCKVVKQHGVVVLHFAKHCPWRLDAVLKQALCG